MSGRIDRLNDWSRGVSDGLGSVLDRVRRAVTRPLDARGALLLGSLVALPGVLMFTTVLWDTDSSRLVASILHVHRNGLGLLTQTQEVLLPHLILGPILWVGGIPAAKAFILLSLIGLTAVIAFITWWFSKSRVATAAAAVGLVSLSGVLNLSTRLPLYLLMLALGYLGMWMSYRVIVDDGVSGPWKPFAIAAAFIVFAAESHAVGQLFLFAPVLLAVFISSRAAALRLAKLYAFVIVFMIPRFVINLLDGGLTNFRTNRSDYFVVKGYVDLINRAFYRLPVDASPLRYISETGDMMFAAVGWSGIAIGVLAAFGLFLVPSRVRWFGIVAILFMLGSLLGSTPPPFGRYVAPILPGFAILGGIALTTLGGMGDRLRPTVFIATCGLLIGGTYSLYSNVEQAQALETMIKNRPYDELAAEVTDEKGVLGARSNVLALVSSDVATYGSQFLTERDFVTYLIWPSGKRVENVMRRNNLGWVLVIPNDALETRLPDTWVFRYHSRHVRAAKKIAKSPRFCLAAEIAEHRLYRLGSDCQ